MSLSRSPTSVSVRFLMNVRVRVWVSSARVAAVQLVVTLGFYSVLCYCVLLLIQCILSSGPFAASSFLLSCRSSLFFLFFRKVPCRFEPCRTGQSYYLRLFLFIVLFCDNSLSCIAYACVRSKASALLEYESERTSSILLLERAIFVV